MDLLLALLLFIPSVEPADTIRYDLPDLIVTTSLKSSGHLTEQPVALTTLTLKELDGYRTEEPKNLSLIVPNLFQADYGSKMTSSIYIRGIGSRMDQPAMGLYLDNVPVLNKNSYDFDYFDLKRVDVLRGPQGTLYGRNTIGGVIDVHTLSPFDYQGVRLRAGYGNGDSRQLVASVYHKPSESMGVSLALSHRYSDGFFTNEYDGSSADRIRSDGGRLKLQMKLSPRWMVENTLFMNDVDQRGFAYSLYDAGQGGVQSVNHNDACSYRRFNLTEGIAFHHQGERLRFSSVSSYQYLDDKMVLDQDFLPISLFTLRQSQRENTFTQELILRTDHDNPWQWISGFFGFYRRNRMEAPVLFKRDGIDDLILGNANKGIHAIFPDADLLIREDEFAIESDFRLPVYGLSLYHQSSYETGDWLFTAGVRADFERTEIRYVNSAEIHYRFTMTMPEYRRLPVEMDGKQAKSYFELLPRFAVTRKTPFGSLYAAVSRGYKAGGYNTQIFSDVLQNRMMNAMMSDLGVYFEGYEPGYDADDAISYKPEYSWNYEVGGLFRLPDLDLTAEVALFYIDCRDQQLTVFPPGKSTGRLMSNAGRTRSYGAELSMTWKPGDFLFRGSYGFTNARFRKYDDGNEDYSGKRVPYAPGNTVSVTGEYNLNLPSGWGIDRILFSAGWRATGKIYWDEANLHSQPFYGLLDAGITLRKDRYSLRLWGENLTDTDYNTFYFKSVGNAFVQLGLPARFGLTVNANF